MPSSIHRTFAKALLASCVILPAMIASPSFATEQTAPADDAAAGTDDQIVVTARLRQERLQDVPISVSVASGAALEQGAVRNLEDLTSRLPNVRIAQVPGSDSINIRGVGSGNNLGFEQSVATFVDGVYRSRSRAHRLGFFDIERVEVLRGPQTTFFGNNAIAGALNITTRTPGDTFDYNASALSGLSDGEYSFEGGVSIPVSDTLAVRFAGRASGLRGYIHNRANDTDGPNTDDLMGRVSVQWKPTERLTINARVDRGRIRGTGIYNSEALNCPPSSDFGTPRGACARYLAAPNGPVDTQLDHSTYTGPSHLAYDFLEAAVKATIDLGDHKLTSISSYLEHDFDQLVNVLPVRNGGVTSASEFGLPTRSIEALHQYSQELRIESDFGGALNYMVGAYYMEDKINGDNRTGNYFAPFGLLYAPAYYTATSPIAVYWKNRQKDQSFSVFGSTRADLTDRLTANIGLRYSIVHKESTRSGVAGTSDYWLTDVAFVAAPAAVQTALLTATGSDAGAYLVPTRTDRKLMPSASLQYKLGADAMTYASYAKGFKAGGNAIGLSNASFDPETVDAFEVGAKASLFDRLLTLNLALFYSEYKNLQEATYVNINGVPKGSIANAARSTAKGVELGGTLRPASGLSFNFDLAYLSSKYDDYTVAPCTALQGFQTPTGTTCIQDLSGKDRAYAPKWSGNVGFSYSLPVDSDNRVLFDTNLFFTSKYFQQATADPLFLQEGFAKLDARIGFGPRDGRWEFAVIGKNLTDKTTAAFRSNLPSSPGAIQAITDRARSVAIQFSVHR